jgi:hypothetical protein
MSRGRGLVERSWGTELCVSLINTYVESWWCVDVEVDLLEEIPKLIRDVRRRFTRKGRRNEALRLPVFPAIDRERSGTAMED